MQKYGEAEVIDDKESAGSDVYVPPGIPPFQSILMDFLDSRAPLLGELCFLAVKLNRPTISSTYIHHKFIDFCDRAINVVLKQTKHQTS